MFLALQVKFRVILSHFSYNPAKILQGREVKEESKGTLYGLCAFVFWGLVPIYFNALANVNAFEVLIHRILWSIALLFILVIIVKQQKMFILTIQNKEKLKILFLSSILISINWLVFIWAIGHNQIIETSLGYYINPLVNVFLGILFFAERPNKLQILAIFLAFIAIFYQIITLGKIPYVSLALAFSFGFYGMARKKANIASITGLFIETLLISPFALIYLLYLIYTHQNAFILPMDSTSYLLLFAGFITVVPLLWFNSATIRIPLVKLGFLQYLSPSISFLLAIFYFHEPFNTDKLYTFILIWIALIIFSLSNMQKLHTVKFRSKQD